MYSVDGVQGYMEVSFMTLEGMHSLTKMGIKLLFGGSRERKIDVVGSKGSQEPCTIS